MEHTAQSARLSPPAHWTVGMLASRLSVSRHTVRRWCQLGHLPGVRRVGPRQDYRIPRSVCLQLAEGTFKWGAK